MSNNLSASQSLTLSLGYKEPDDNIFNLYVGIILKSGKAKTPSIVLRYMMKGGRIVSTEVLDSLTFDIKNILTYKPFCKTKEDEKKIEKRRGKGSEKDKRNMINRLISDWLAEINFNVVMGDYPVCCYEDYEKILKSDAEDDEEIRKFLDGLNIESPMPGLKGAPVTNFQSSASEASSFNSESEANESEAEVSSTHSLAPSTNNNSEDEDEEVKMLRARVENERPSSKIGQMADISFKNTPTSSVLSLSSSPMVSEGESAILSSFSAPDMTMIKAKALENENLQASSNDKGKGRMIITTEQDMMLKELKEDLISIFRFADFPVTNYYSEHMDQYETHLTDITNKFHDFVDKIPIEKCKMSVKEEAKKNWSGLDKEMLMTIVPYYIYSDPDYEEQIMLIRSIKHDKYDISSNITDEERKQQKSMFDYYSSIKNESKDTGKPLKDFFSPDFLLTEKMMIEQATKNSLKTAKIEGITRKNPGGFPIPIIINNEDNNTVSEKKVGFRTERSKGIESRMKDFHFDDVDVNELMSSNYRSKKSTTAPSLSTSSSNLTKSMNDVKDYINNKNRSMSTHNTSISNNNTSKNKSNTNNDFEKFLKDSSIEEISLDSIRKERENTLSNYNKKYMKDSKGTKSSFKETSVEKSGLFYSQSNNSASTIKAKKSIENIDSEEGNWSDIVPQTPNSEDYSDKAEKKEKRVSFSFPDNKPLEPVFDATKLPVLDFSELSYKGFDPIKSIESKERTKRLMDKGLIDFDNMSTDEDEKMNYEPRYTRRVSNRRDMARELYKGPIKRRHDEKMAAIERKKWNQIKSKTKKSKVFLKEKSNSAKVSDDDELSEVDINNLEEIDIPGTIMRKSSMMNEEVNNLLVYNGNEILTVCYDSFKTAVFFLLIPFIMMVDYFGKAKTPIVTSEHRASGRIRPSSRSNTISQSTSRIRPSASDIKAKEESDKKYRDMGIELEDIDI